MHYLGQKLKAAVLEYLSYVNHKISILNTYCQFVVMETLVRRNLNRLPGPDSYLELGYCQCQVGVAVALLNQILIVFRNEQLCDPLEQPPVALLSRCSLSLPSKAVRYNWKMLQKVLMCSYGTTSCPQTGNILLSFRKPLILFLERH